MAGSETQWAVQVRVGDGEDGVWTSQPQPTRDLAVTLLDGLKPSGKAWIVKRQVVASNWERDG